MEFQVTRGFFRSLEIKKLKEKSITQSHVPPPGFSPKSISYNCVQILMIFLIYTLITEHHATQEYTVKKISNYTMHFSQIKKLCNRKCVFK